MRNQPEIQLLGFVQLTIAYAKESYTVFLGCDYYRKGPLWLDRCDDTCFVHAIDFISGYLKSSEKAPIWLDDGVIVHQ